MSDGRRRRRAKQARRDARRAKTRDGKTSEQEPIIGLVRAALATKHPLGLLGLASTLIRRTAPDPLAELRSGPRDRLSMDGVIENLIRVKHRETTVLLAVLAELMVDEPTRRARCRQAVAARKDSLPKWISALPDIQLRRAVRATHVLGDEDQLLIGFQLAGRYEITCIVHINHHMMSEIDDADFLPGSIDEVITSAIERNEVSDVSFADMSLADAGAWIRHGLDQPLFPRESDTWPNCLAVVRWLIAQLPDGGVKYRNPEWDWTSLSKLFRTFLATRSGSHVDDFDRRVMLFELVESGNGDPLRWSVARIEQVLSGVSFYDAYLELESVLELPELLREFVPFAHAQSGIREGLTAEALAVIDEMEPAYKREVLAKSDYWE